MSYIGHLATRYFNFNCIMTVVAYIKWWYCTYAYCTCT